jgi:hypothetical protein
MPFQKSLTGAGCAPAQAVNITGGADPNVVALGSTNLTAYPMQLGNTQFGTVSASTGGILPQFATTGDTCLIFNNGASALTVYPPVGGTINAGASVSVAAAGWIIAACATADGLTWRSK